MQSLVDRASAAIFLPLHHHTWALVDSQSVVVMEILPEMRGEKGAVLRDQIAPSSIAGGYLPQRLRGQFILGDQSLSPDRGTTTFAAPESLGAPDALYNKAMWSTDGSRHQSPDCPAVLEPELGATA